MKWPIAAYAIAAIVTIGCGKPVPVDTSNWSRPLEVSQSRDSLGSSFGLHKWNNSLLAVNGDSGSVVVYFLEENEKTWRKEDTRLPNSRRPSGFDPMSNRFTIAKVSMVGEKMDVTFSRGAISQDGDQQIISEKSLAFTVKTFFEGPSLGVTFSRRATTAVLPKIVMAESSIWVTYSLFGDNSSGRFADGPFANGVFFSSDSGLTWQKQQISNLNAAEYSFCKTKEFEYFVFGTTTDGVIYGSRSQSDADEWESPQIISRTFGPSGFIRRIEMVGVNDTAHLCWLDRRHEKKSLSPFSADRGNYEVAYCHRKDSDTEWSKDVIISEGLLYSYQPVLSVEGDNLLIAWAGVENAGAGHNEFSPNDIFFATSKDGGKTWSKPLKVTDRAKDGMTSGRPKVALHNGVIHLFYIQGKNSFEQVGGAIKVNQPPWPIYYQRRPFPK